MSYTQTELETMARHYCIAAVWADAPEGTSPRTSKHAMAHATRAAERFLGLIGPEMLVALREAHKRGYGTHPDCGNVAPLFAAIGHDLYLTSAGHGAGFWDRDELEADSLGEKLSEFCGCSKPMGEPGAWFQSGWLYFD